MAALFVTEAEAAAVLDMAGAVRAVEASLRQQADGRAQAMAKTHAAWDGGTLHAIGGVSAGEGLAGTKTWVHTARGAAPYLLLFDTQDGHLRGLVEAFALGQLRTAAVSAVATRWMSDPGADEMAVIGTGKQALTQVAAVAAVRPLRRVRVHSRSRDNVAAFCGRVTDRLGIRAVPAGSVAEAVRDAPVVTLATRATAPFLAPDLPAPGAHVNAIGAITPERIEFEPGLLGRCSVVAADSVDQARELSAEFRAFYGPDPAGWSPVRRLADLAPGGPGTAGDGTRPRDGGLTLFKSLGVGLFDIALGAHLLRLAEARGLGRPLPAPVRAAVRLGPDQDAAAQPPRTRREHRR